jgi:hypothetical protein
MYKAYLDNNIIVSIEDGDHSVEQFVCKNDCAYYFSQAHIEELLEAKDNPKVSQDGRLNLIAKLCGRNHILTGGDTVPEFFDKEPIEIYYSVKYNFIRQLILQSVSQGDKLASLFRQTLGFDSKQFNNEAPEETLGIIDDRMRNKIGVDLYTWLIQTEANNGRAIYHTLLQIIDMANYWGDKKTNHSNVARMYDAAHAYFAQICDVLITNDKKMSKKVKAIYSFMNVKTKVVTANDFLK